MIVRHCSSCTARQQELNRLKKRVNALEAELALLRPPGALETEAERYLCVACGHMHPKTITRHHRVPQRVAWKIPHHIRRQILGDEPEIVNLCQRCHRFVEVAAATSKPAILPQPCAQPIGPAATITWARLMQEIRAFDRIAENITTELLAVIRDPAGQETRGHFGSILNRALTKEEDDNDVTAA